MHIFGGVGSEGRKHTSYFSHQHEFSSLPIFNDQNLESHLSVFASTSLNAV